MITREEILSRENLWYKVLVTLVFTFLTGIAAQIRIPLPFSPVPVTGQTFVILLAPLFINKLAVFSQILYVLLGVLGIPWFSGNNSGFHTLIGPTGGYLIGFIFASLFISQIFKPNRFKVFNTVTILLVANFGIIYSFGLTQLYLWFSFKQVQLSLPKLLSMGLLPFIPGDLIKIMLVSATYFAFRKITR
ncbi:biotin transporter BioY [Thermotoga profunda]|uniref:biotin transporter BioY n=1 Tax=Thermotoga profunda TaxID=1508420 RepID=UPI000694A73A|nr:biotin transporter BioY [Thermotoga profunda]